MSDHTTHGASLGARVYNSGFDLAHDTYNGIVASNDGRIYYVLCSQAIDVGAQMYSYDPVSDKIQHLGDLTEACGEEGLRTIVQGKCHTTPLESDGNLYLGTHCGYYNTIEGNERMGIPLPGYEPYPGGHFLAYNLRTGKFQDLALLSQEAILAMTMDARRGCLYGLSWPTGCFLIYDLNRKELKDLGPVSEQNENGRGSTYATICRSLIVDPEDGSVYFTTATGSIFRYRCDQNRIEMVEGVDMRKDYFGSYDPSAPGHLAYHWRQTMWYEPERVIYGVHGNSGYLFRFDPRTPRLELIERLASTPSKRSGMYDQFSYGYLGFALGPDGRTVHYLTGGPIYVNGKRVTGKTGTAKGESKGPENLHLVTYDIPNAKYTDHGPIFFENGQRPSYVNSIAIAKDGTIYALSRIEENGRTDLISIPSPL